jgi:Transposase
VAHLAEPVETRALRGRKRRAKTDREDARWLRQLLAEGRLPEAWIPLEHVRQWRSRARLRHTLIGERTQWLQRIQATLFHHGVSGTPDTLRTRAGRAFLDELELPEDALERIEIALAMIEAIDTQIAPLERELRQLARRQTGCRALMGLYGIGELTALVTLCELGDVQRLSASRKGRPDGRHRRRRAPGLRAPRPVHVRERGAGRPRRQLRLAVLHGQQAGVPRPDRRRHATHHQRARLRARWAGERRHGRLVRLRQPHQRLDPQHGPTELPHQTGTGRDAGAMRPANVVPPRQPGDRRQPADEHEQQVPGVPASARRRRRAELRGGPAAAVPVCDGERRDDHERPRLPRRRGRGGRLGALAGVLGRALVPAQPRRPEHQARAAARPGRPTRTAASRCTPTACATR